jgi:16S rRNA (cytidine1402-2'-O)-methyltransferase
LYVVATPIGNLEDISARALRTLSEVEIIAAEDKRHTAKLLARHHIAARSVPYHEHNEDSQGPRLIEILRAGTDVALVSDAGTPLVSDPGYRLVRAAHETGIAVRAIPGACAAIAALSVSGLPTDRFVFEGFLPAKGAARRARIGQLKPEARTLVFYEAPSRVIAMLRDLREVLGGEREATVARELTKAFETVRRDTLGELCAWIEGDENQRRGEFVIVVGGGHPDAGRPDAEGEVLLAALLDVLPVRDAAATVARVCGGSKNDWYRLAIKGKGTSSK